MPRMPTPSERPTKRYAPCSAMTVSTCRSLAPCRGPQIEDVEREPFTLVPEVCAHRRAQPELGVVGDRNERGTAAQRLGHRRDRDDRWRRVATASIGPRPFEVGLDSSWPCSASCRSSTKRDSDIPSRSTARTTELRDISARRLAARKSRDRSVPSCG